MDRGELAGQRHDPYAALQGRPRGLARRRYPLCVTSLSTTAKILLQHVHDRWSIEHSWNWPRDTQFRKDALRYRESNGVQIMATLRSLAMDALRLDGFWSITKGMAALSHDIRGLLALVGWREPAQAPIILPDFNESWECRL